MEQGIKFLKRADFLRFSVVICLSRIRDVEGLSRIVEDGRAFLNSRGKVAVHTEDVICDHPVVFFVHVVRDDKKKIETGEEGIGKCDIPVGIFVDIILKT